LDKVNDPAKGTYYVETLTDALAEEAWTMFQFLEQSGGFLAAVTQGIVSDKVEKNAAKMKAAMADKTMVLVGVNKYQPNEGTPETISKENALNVVNFLRPKRLAEDFEQ